MALLTAALARWSGITTWMREWPRRSQVHEPFVHGHLRRPERLFVNDRLLPFIHSIVDRILVPVIQFIHEICLRIDFHIKRFLLSRRL